MIQIFFTVIAFLIGLVMMGKGKQITINRKNRVISELKQERSNLLSEVGHYKTAKTITDSVSSTSIAIDSLRTKVLKNVDTISAVNKVAEVIHESDEPSPPESDTMEEAENSEDEEASTEEEDNEKIYVLAADQSNRTNRIADLLR